MTLMVAACLALAALSLPLNSMPSNDPWGWLVWGREIAQLDPNTVDGPSWKPLPVLFTTVFSLFGDAAPELWLVVARAAGLLALVLAYRLASRFAGPAAGVAAALLLILTPSDAGWLIYMAKGVSEPLVVALVLSAVERHLDGRPEHSFALAVLAGLARPEAWPFVAAYAIALWPRTPTARPLVLFLSALIPILWFGGDWWGSGELFTGGERARGGERASLAVDRLLARPLLAVRQAADLVIEPVWPLAAATVAAAQRAGERAPVVLGAAALGWLGVVVVLAMVGFAGAPRFMLPAAALLCVLAGIGAGRLMAAVGRLAVLRTPRRTLSSLPVGRLTSATAAAALALVALPVALPRAALVAPRFEGVQIRAAMQDDLVLAVNRAGGGARLRGCGRLGSRVFATTLAWELEVPIEAIPRRLRPPGVALVRDREKRAASEPPRGDARVMARAPGWSVVGVGPPCGRAGELGRRAAARLAYSRSHGRD